MSAKPTRSSRSKVYGTAANELTRCSRTASQKHGSTTEWSVRYRLAPTARWEFSTDRP
jgi:hypothetical protein